MKQTKRFKRFAMAMTIVAMLAMSVMPSFATMPTGLNLIGASPSQMKEVADIANYEAYGVDSTIPIILAFSGAVPSGVTASDISLTKDGNTAIPFTLSAWGNEITLIPDQVVYTPNTIFTIAFSGNLTGINGFTFKTKEIGSGAVSKRPLYCIGTIAFDGAANVLRDQNLLFTFTNNVQQETGNANQVTLLQWTGTGTPAADRTNPGWVSVEKSVILGQGNKWSIGVDPTATLDANTVYRAYIGTGLVAKSGEALAEAVDVMFTTGAN